ncbi:MAG: endonuclease/exonuclease/phosphatase family protein [Lentisphaerae bacterium]|nr:endonuclease/exonuclease/phosphatase family protein [Lentisphaerota bacterium]
MSAKAVTLTGMADQPLQPVSAAQKFLSTRFSLRGLLETGGGALCLGTVAGFLGPLAWWLDLAAHFRLQYLAGLLLLAVLFAVFRRSRMAAVFLAFALVNLALIVPLFLPGPNAHPAGATPTLRALLANVNTRRGDPTKVLDLIRREKPDFILLEEVGLKWQKSLAPLRDQYPYGEWEPRDDNFGIALLSRRPFLRSGTVMIGGEVPSVYAQFDFDGQPFTIVGTHPLPPAGAAYSWYRNDQLARLPEFLRRIRGPVLLLGDLNTTPWSYTFQNLLKESGLKDSAQGRGPLLTWPAFAHGLGIPIDHALHSSDIVITGRRMGDDIASDHFPVILDFAVTASP